MRPEWFKCENCLFAIIKSMNKNHSDQVICSMASEAKSKCLHNFCKEWICEHCWNSWDTCDYPDTKEDWVGIYHNHNICGLVKFKGEG